MGISLAVKIWGDSTPLLTELEKVKKHLNQVSKELTKMGSALSMALTLPIVAFGALSVKNFGEAEKAAVSLAAAIRANGKDVESTMSGYDAFAAKMQEMTTHEDDAVRGFLQLAESMQAPDVKKATQDAIGLNAAYGIEMTAAIKMATAAQLGNFTMLGKAVPAIKMMKDTTEKAALANKIFADGFTMATDQAKSGLGPLEQMKNDLNNMTESFGKIILEGLTPMIKHLKDFAKWLDSLSESTKRWVLGILAVVAAAGPLLFVMGKLPGILSVMINGFTMLTGVIKSMIVFLAANPWIILAAAIAAVGVAFYLHATRVTAAEAATKALNDTTAKAIENIASEKQHVEGLLATARNEKISKEERLKAVKDLNDISPKYFGNLTLEKVKTEDATTATKLYCEALLAKAKVEIATTEIAKLMAENDKIAAGASDAGKLDGWQKTTALIVGVLDVFGKVTKDGTSASMEFNMVQQNTKEKLANNNAQIAVYNDFISKNIGLIDTSAKAHISHAEGIGKEADAIAEIDKKIKSLKTTLDNQIVSGDKNAQSTANQIVQLEKLKASYEGLADIMMGKVSLKPTTPGTASFTEETPAAIPAAKPALYSKDEMMWDKWKKGVPVIESSSDKIGKMKTGLDSMTGSLGPLADSFKNVFSKIATVVQDVASGFADGWKSAINDVGALVQSVVGAIGGILSTNFSNRENEMSDYYSNEKDAIENSTMNEKGKSDALKKLGKEEQKERKKLMRDQAKDQKTVAIIQAIISGALATVMAFATPGVGIAMGLIVAALSAVEIAAIIAQPLPSLAEGGLAFAPTMAMVGDNPNAAADPEVIAPLSKIRSLFQGAAQKIEIFGRLAGSDIFLSSEKGGVTVQRVRGY